jgi:hypothetical protein
VLGPQRVPTPPSIPKAKRQSQDADSQQTPIAPIPTPPATPTLAPSPDTASQQKPAASRNVAQGVAAAPQQTQYANYQQPVNYQQPANYQQPVSYQQPVGNGAVPQQAAGNYVQQSTYQEPVATSTNAPTLQYR